jgi:5-methylcytosine-specific restriction protein A
MTQRPVPKKITPEQIREAYDLGKAVFGGQMAFKDAVKALETGLEMNPTTAGYFVDDYRALREGVEFQRSLSAPAMDLYFAWILDDDGRDALARALASLQKHIDYYEGVRTVHLKKMRAVVAKHQAILAEPVRLDAMLTEFDAQVRKALGDTAAARAARLRVANKQPVKVLAVVEVYARNPDVVAEVLDRARGECESCRKPAPFLRRADGSPYLEVHHVKRLADGGEDSADNAIANCPNCHRKAHFGAAEQSNRAKKGANPQP